MKQAIFASVASFVAFNGTLGFALDVLRSDGAAAERRTILRRVLAALAVQGATARLPLMRAIEFIPRLRAAAAQIGSTLG
jgi:hypothetical protein